MFHRKCGALVSLSNNNRTAQRNHPSQEFNNGVVISIDSLQDDQLFEVTIDKKINSWSGSIEIGVTTCDPNNLQFPASATDFREGTWVLSGSCVLMNGRSIVEEYGYDLDQLCEGDRVGVMRTRSGSLHFFVDGQDFGLAASDIPARVFAVIDLYGKCVQVTVTETIERRIISNEAINESLVAMGSNHQEPEPPDERLCFHERCGSLIKLSSDRRTAERRRPLDEFNNGVVMTQRPLQDEEMFAIMLDRLVDKWSGSIEVGITTHNPNTMDFPATMTNMRSGTIMMSGCGILTNGKGTRREYGDFNLDELVEGDRIGLMRKHNGSLHYYINGVDQGVAATRVPNIVFGVIDLYGMAVKVKLTDDDNVQSIARTFGVNFETRAQSLFQQLSQMYMTDIPMPVLPSPDLDADRLLFHPHCGTHARVVDGGRAAIRPNAIVDFNNAVVLTNRPLRPNELFEIQIDKVVDKWAGSVEIGVTTHPPLDLDFPSTMTNVRSGTWMMTGNGVIHNGTTILEEYGQNLDRLKVGDKVGVMRKADGTLHFYVNGTDQGTAAATIPEPVYGVIDLYGQAARAIIVDHSGLPLPPVAKVTTTSSSSVGTDREEAVNSSSTQASQLLFHQQHGKNAVITAGGLTASRPNAHGEFNDAIVMSNRPLGDGEVFEVMIEKMVERWSGSIEAGMTTIKPDELEFPNTMTDIDYETWMLSGSAIMQDGSTIRNGYACDLDTLTVGSRIGMSRLSDGTLHYYVDGADMGVACVDIPSGVYAVVDLYGQCAQVSIKSETTRVQPENHSRAAIDSDPPSVPFITEISHRFSMCCGKHILLKNSACTAIRSKSYDHGLVFSAQPMRLDEIFEIQIDSVSRQWAGCMKIGVTTYAINESMPRENLPATASHLADLRSKVTWVISGSRVSKNNVAIHENFAPSLERIEANTRIGVMVCSDGTLHLFLNSEDMGVAATNIPKKVHAVVDVFGIVDTITVTSASITHIPASPRGGAPLVHFLKRETFDDEGDIDTKGQPFVEFHNHHGNHIRLSNSNRTATRIASYNNGIILSSKPLQPLKLFEVSVDRVNPGWMSGLVIGVIGTPPEKLELPPTAPAVKGLSWLVQGSSIFHNGVKVKGGFGVNLDTVTSGRVGLLLDLQGCLHLYVNGVDQGEVARDLPSQCYVLVDVYATCEQVSIVTDAEAEGVASVTSACVKQEDKEKADMESGKTEKLLITPSVEPAILKNCEYMKTCAALIASLGIPDVFFNSALSVCYCETCYRARGDEPYFKGGNPPKDYGIPFGWCRFALRIAPRFENMMVSESWHMAFHGTRLGAVRRILDHGELLLPGDVALGGKRLTPYVQPVGKNKIKEDISQIFLSPSVHYVSNDMFAPRQEFMDTHSVTHMHARVAFQACVRPGSYKVGPQTIGASHTIDPHFSNNEIEWYTKERGATALYGLLVKVEQ